MYLDVCHAFALNRVIFGVNQVKLTNLTAMDISIKARNLCLCMCSSNISADQDQTDQSVSIGLLHGSRVCNVAFVWTTMISLINYFINALRILLALSTVATIVTCAPEPITAHYSHVHTRANHCRAYFYHIP